MLQRKFENNTVMASTHIASTLNQQYFQMIQSQAKNLSIEQIATESCRIINEMLNYLNSGYYIVDCKTFLILFANQEIRMRYPNIDFNKPCYENFFSYRSKPCTCCPILHGATPCTYSKYEVFKSDSKLWLHVSSYMFQLYEDTTVCLFNCVDITDKKNIEQDIYEMMMVDQLTEISNYNGYKVKGRKLLDAAQLNGNKVAYICFDINNLKTVNDTLGYGYSDKLLKQFVQEVNTVLSKQAHFARLGGGDFVVLFPYCEELCGIEAVYRLIEEIIGVGKMIELPSQLTDPLSISVGASIYPDDAQTLDELNIRARISIKYLSAHKNLQYKFYDRSVMQMISNRDKLERDLKFALENQLFELYFQPLVDLKTEKIISFEALVRWKDEKRGMQSASEFIHIIEEMGLIIQLDNWVINEICKQVRTLNDKKIQFHKVTFNISALKFFDKDFVNTLLQSIIKYDIEPSQLEIELTERIALKNIEYAAALIKKLNNNSISVSIDDFGTGYSSLSYLKYLPANTLKLDKSFLEDVAYNKVTQNIVSSVIDMAKKIHFTVVCEGVENKEQLNFIKNTACDIAQGYYYYRPMSFDRLIEILESQM